MLEQNTDIKLPGYLKRPSISQRPQYKEMDSERNVWYLQCGNVYSNISTSATN
jgi:hypothetical protein